MLQALLPRGSSNRRAPFTTFFAAPVMETGEAWLVKPLSSGVAAGSPLGCINPVFTIAALRGDLDGSLDLSAPTDMVRKLLQVAYQFRNCVQHIRSYRAHALGLPLLRRRTRHKRDRYWRRRGLTTTNDYVRSRTNGVALTRAVQ